MNPLRPLVRWFLRRMFAQAPIVTECAWCPGKAERTRRAEAWGFAVSHGMCPSCRDRELKQLRCSSVRDITKSSFAAPRLTRASLSPV